MHLVTRILIAYGSTWTLHDGPPALRRKSSSHTKSGSGGKRSSRVRSRGAGRRFDTPNFVRMCETWTLAVLSVMNSRLKRSAGSSSPGEDQEGRPVLAEASAALDGAEVRDSAAAASLFASSTAPAKASEGTPACRAKSAQRVLEWHAPERHCGLKSSGERARAPRASAGAEQPLGLPPPRVSRGIRTFEQLPFRGDLRPRVGWIASWTRGAGFQARPAAGRRGPGAPCRFVRHSGR